METVRDFEDMLVLLEKHEVSAKWIGLDSLLKIKSSIDEPRHREDARVLGEVKKRRE